MDVKQSMSRINQQLNAFGFFVSDKLKHFSTLTINEKIAYPVIGVGLLLFLVGIVLLIV